MSYKCSANIPGQLADQQENDFAKLYSDFSRFTQQIYYLSRGEVSRNVDKVLLNPEQVEHAHLSHVEMFQAKQNFLYFEEEQAAAKNKR